MIMFFMVPMFLFMLTFIAGSIITVFGGKHVAELVQVDLGNSLATKIFTGCLVVFIVIAVIAGAMGLQPEGGVFLFELAKCAFFGMIAASWYWLYECYRDGVCGKIVEILKK